MTDALGDYLNGIGRIPLLTASEEVHLATMVQEWLHAPAPVPALERRGRRAMGRMVSANLRLVVSICQRQRRGLHLQVELMDLIQAGNLGLFRAVERFDPTRGYKFSTYGYWWIRQGVTRYLREFGQAIKVPPDLSDLARRAAALQSTSSGRLSTGTMARVLGQSEQRLAFALEVSHRSRMVSLDQQLGGDESDVTLMDVLSDGRPTVIQEDYRWLHEQLYMLSPEERNVLHLRYGDDEAPSLARVATLTGLNKGKVQWIERQALAKLRRQIDRPLMQG